MRGPYRWGQTFEAVKLGAFGKNKGLLRKKGVYLITGGLSGIGLTLARHLAKTVQARLILIGYSDFPERYKWEEWLAEHGEENRVSRKIKTIKEMERSGAKVLPITADVSDPRQMDKAADLISGSFERIDGVVHSAGIADWAGIIQKRTKAMTEAVLAPKVKGTLLLDNIIKNFKPDFFLLCSSLATVHFKGLFGQSAYVAANEFLDAFAHHRFVKGDRFVISVNWDTWQEVGMAVDAAAQKGFGNDAIQHGISPAEGVEIFNRILGKSPQLIVSTSRLMTCGEQDAHIENLSLLSRKETSKSWSGGPVEGSTPENEIVIERILTDIWQECLGIEEIETDDDFFELGGDSLLGTQIISRVLERLEINLSNAILFDKPTIAGLSEHIGAVYRNRNKVKQLSDGDAGEGRERVSL